MLKALVTLLIFAWHLLLSAFAVRDELLVCKPANALFTDVRNGSIAVGEAGQCPHCRTGKMGPKGGPGVQGLSGIQGPSGFVGATGPAGPPGPPTEVDYDRVERYVQERKRGAASCFEIKRLNRTATNGLYDIEDNKGSIYRTYCDMSTGGGGWTLIASVHENFMGGKCTTGDRWSSEHGNNAQHPHGDGAWENTRMFGSPESAASDDYKNQGYFNMAARDVMIWHVPNNTPLDQYRDRSFMMYHTTSGFLANYGGNLYKLFKDHYPLRDRVYQRGTGNGPSPAVVWDRGNNALMVQNTPPNCRAETIPGFIQFRAINNERGAFAVCPGLKITSRGGNVEHYCIGGTSNHGGSARQCGDFASKDWSGYGANREWSSNRAMTESVVMIFCR